MLTLEGRSFTLNETAQTLQQPPVKYDAAGIIYEAMTQLSEFKPDNKRHLATSEGKALFERVQYLMLHAGDSGSVMAYFNGLCAN